jgi:DNA-binding transcriptional regulator LsrR (DeoR family)
MVRKRAVEGWAHEMPQHLSDTVLMSRVARAYFLEDQSRIDIAAELGISRFRVARLLAAARTTGMVHIEIRSSGLVNTELSIELENKFGLSRAIVLDIAADPLPALRAQLSRAAGQLLTELAQDGDYIGLSWARSLAKISDGVEHLSKCPVVQMTGALSDPDGSDVLELVRQVARAGGGAPHVFYAPIVVDNPAMARSLRRQPEVARALKLIDSVSIALVGIGSWRAGQSTIFESLSPTDREQPALRDIVAEVSGVLVDANGQPREAPLSRRIIGPSGAQLQAIPNVIAVAYGAEKAEGIGSVLTGTLINSLVTHTEMAEALLKTAT